MIDAAIHPTPLENLSRIYFQRTYPPASRFDHLSLNRAIHNNEAEMFAFSHCLCIIEEKPVLMQWVDGSTFVMGGHNCLGQNGRGDSHFQAIFLHR
jgi:hypothetical protein